MSRVFRTLSLAVTLGMVASASQAQTVAMYGEYHESNGIIVNIPQNPPVVPCVPPPRPAFTPMDPQFVAQIDPRPTGVNDARCHDREQHFFGSTMAPGVFNQPDVGNKGARIVNGGLAVGNPFTIPPFAFQQNLGPQVGIVIANAVRQLDTTFLAAMPGVDRIGPRPGPGITPMGAGPSYTPRTAMQLIPAPALTRMFSAMNWNNPGNGQNNGDPAGLVNRPSADFPVFRTAAGGNEVMTLRYNAGPNEFGGTMALLLDGRGRLNLVVSQFSAMLPNSWKPAFGTQPVGDQVPGWRLRNGAGFDYVAPGTQMAGRLKALFGAIPANLVTPMGAPRIAPSCGVVPPFPAGCNEINGADTFMGFPFIPTPMGGGPLIPAGGTFGTLKKANSDKHMFAWTTGTVSIIRTAVRNGVPQSDTITGMGYDTVTAMGLQRNVGMVAGSYTVRVDDTGTQLNTQLVGINLKFTPEPTATVALASGLGVLGLLAYRRRA